MGFDLYVETASGALGGHLGLRGRTCCAGGEPPPARPQFHGLAPEVHRCLRRLDG